jgi:hypothetical protein
MAAVSSGSSHERGLAVVAVIDNDDAGRAWVNASPPCSAATVWTSLWPFLPKPGWT